MTLSLFCTLLTLGLSSDSNTVPEWNFALGFVLGLVAAFALVWRHSSPWTVLAVTLLGPLLFSTDATAALIALYAVVKSERSGRLAGAAGAVFVACGISLTYDAHRTRDNSVLTIGTMRPEDTAPKPMWEVAWWIPWLVAAALVTVVVVLALLEQTRSQLTVAERVRDRATAKTESIHDEMIRTEERTRIARDMHDTLAAGLSRISLFAGALQVGGADDPQKTANTAAMIRSTAHESLDELKSIVGVLRGTAGASRASGHQGIDAVADLVQSARAAGLHTVLFTDLQPGDVGTVSGHVTGAGSPHQRSEVRVGPDGAHHHHRRCPPGHPDRRAQWAQFVASDRAHRLASGPDRSHRAGPSDRGHAPGRGGGLRVRRGLLGALVGLTGIL